MSDRHVVTVNGRRIDIDDTATPDTAAPPCCMCDGRGNDFRYITSPPDSAGIVTVVAKQPLPRPCRACLGTGTEPLEDAR